MLSIGRLHGGHSAPVPSDVSRACACRPHSPHTSPLRCSIANMSEKASHCTFTHALHIESIAWMQSHPRAFFPDFTPCGLQVLGLHGDEKTYGDIYRLIQAGNMCALPLWLQDLVPASINVASVHGRMLFPVINVPGPPTQFALKAR
eukprot:6343515-Amphidinium_carterae.1